MNFLYLFLIVPSFEESEKYIGLVRFFFKCRPILHKLTPVGIDPVIFGKSSYKSNYNTHWIAKL